MKTTPKSPLTRRSLLFGLAALPAVVARTWADDVEPPSRVFFQEPPPVKSAEQVLDVMEFEPLARAALPPAHFGYIATGSDDDRTLIQNHEAYNRYQIRAHRFSDLSRLRTSRSVSAVRGRVPVFLDGGIRRGTDIFKALALGATAVGIGRPQAWGLAAIMRQAGTPSIEDIVRADVIEPAGRQ